MTPAKGINAHLPKVLSWLDQPSARLIQSRTRAWDEENWAYAMQGIKIHGISVFLYYYLQQADDTLDQLPAPFIKFLEKMAKRLYARNERMFAELEQILKAAHEAGLALMPLKGSLLAQRYYPTPYLRPMADLDLLVKPGQEHHATQLLVSIGYKTLMPDNPAARERHIRFVKPGNERVVSLEGPDPDNPRPVELHTRLSRMLWGDVKIEDSAEMLWGSAREITFLGYPVFIPPIELLFTYQAMHTVDHMMLRTARGIQFVDLSLMAPHMKTKVAVPKANWIYPALELARRIMPTTWNIDLAYLESGTDLRLVNWSKHVPLDFNCGLVIDPKPPFRRRIQLHYERWWPSKWRLIIAYPDLPIPRALMRHGRSMLARLGKRLVAPDHS